jgi:hypothetical protein
MIVNMTSNTFSRFLAALIFVAVLSTAQANAQARKVDAGAASDPYPRTYCTNRGARVEAGQRACLVFGDLAYLARCNMVLNNPSWERIGDGCPDQSNPTQKN